MEPLILIAEDEPAQAEMLRYNLNREGYRTIIATDGEEALLCIEEEEPDVVILDWMLPKASGIEVCRQLRNQGRTRQLPILMVTARGEEPDLTRGLDAGADDYLVKPFSPKEMIARMRAILRRYRPSLAGEVLSYGAVTMDTSRRRVHRDGRSVDLSPTEFRLLHTLLERPGHVYSRDTLLDRVMGLDADVEPRTIDVHIGRLRKKLNARGETNIIRTVRTGGYSIDCHLS